MRKSDFSYEIVKHIGILSESRSGWKKEINLVSWNERAAKYDIREWTEDHSQLSKGVTLTEDEARKLTAFLKAELPES